MNIKNHVGEKFGKLTAIEKLDSKLGKSYYLFRCECGHECPLRYWIVSSGKMKQCSKCSKTSGKYHHGWKGCGDLSQSVFNYMRHSAAARNIPFEIDIKYLWKLFQKQGGKCALTGRTLSFEKKYCDGTRTASIDRVDNSKGYVKGNIQWIHTDINYIKSNIENDDFIAVCHEIANHTISTKVAPEHLNRHPILRKRKI